MEKFSGVKRRKASGRRQAELVGAVSHGVGGLRKAEGLVWIDYQIIVRMFCYYSVFF